MLNSAKLLTKNNSIRFDLTTAAEFALVTLIWGSTWLVIKGQLGVVPPAWSVAYRFVLAATLLTGFTVATGRWQWPTRAGHAFALVVGTTQFALNFNLVYAAENRLASGIVALVFALLVVPNTILAAVFLKTPISLRFSGGATLSVVGLILLFAPDLAGPHGSDALVGVALLVGAIMAASIGNVLQAGRFGRSLPPLPALALAMTYGAVINVIFAVATIGGPRLDPRAEYWLGLAYLSVAASVVAFSVYYRLIRRIGPGPAAYSSVLVPVIAMSLSTVFERYRWTPTAGAGAILALIGLLVAVGGRRMTVNKGTHVALPGNRQTLG